MWKCPEPFRATSHWKIICQNKVDQDDKANLIFTQSSQLLLANRVSRSSLPTYLEGRSLIRWGACSNNPNGMYLDQKSKSKFEVRGSKTHLYKNESHSRRNLRVVSTPFVSLPQCINPSLVKSWRMASLSELDISQSLRSLISVKIQGLMRAPL